MNEHRYEDLDRIEAVTDRPGLIDLAQRLHDAECRLGYCATEGHPLRLSRAKALYDLGVRVLFSNSPTPRL